MTSVSFAANAVIPKRNNLLRLDENCLIVLTLIIAYLPLLFFNVVRGDDFVAFQGFREGFWHHHYHNAMTFVFMRPVGQIFLVLSHHIIQKLSHAPIAFFLNILLVGLIGIGIFNFLAQIGWPALKRFVFTVTALTLPSFLVLASQVTGMYVIIAYNFAVFGSYLFVRSFNTIGIQNLTQKFLGTILLTLSIFSYPPATMIVWFLVVVLLFEAKKGPQNMKKAMWLSVVGLSLIGIFLIALKITHYQFLQNNEAYEKYRSVSVEPLILFNKYFYSLTKSIQLWDYKPYDIGPYLNYIPLILKILLLFYFLLKENLQTLFLILLCLFLSVSPVLFSSTGLEVPPFRVLGAHSLIIYFILFSGICLLLEKRKNSKMGFLVFTPVFLISILGLSQYTLLKYHQLPLWYEINYIRSALQEKSLALPVKIHVICPKSHIHESTYAIGEDMHAKTITQQHIGYIPNIIISILRDLKPHSVFKKNFKNTIAGDENLQTFTSPELKIHVVKDSSFLPVDKEAIKIDMDKFHLPI